MTAINMLKRHDELICEALPHCLTATAFPFGTKYQGKVRDTYDLGDKLLLITTDRQSAFDRLLAAVPYKGQALTLTSAWWFEKTESIFPNHLIALPDPNVMIVKKCRVFPIEFIVRGYITGTTNTSIWRQYQNGERQFGGLYLPDGLHKNQALPMPLLTPTTKDKDHDRTINPADILAQGLMSQAEWEEASAAALHLFEFGVALAAKQGLILVDTKYEFGRDQEGRIVLVDEIHTQDSSRYWLATSYQDRLAQGKEPENFDKELLRLWFAEHCDPYHDKILPDAPPALIAKLASRYIQLYEMLTGNSFSFTQQKEKIENRIKKNIAGWLG